MSKFELDKNLFENILDQSLKVGGTFFHGISLINVPRDWEKAPNPIILKTKEVPERNIRKGNKNYYRKPVQKNGLWYEGVTGNLKRSIGIENTGHLEYTIGVRRGPTEEYAGTQEFGSLDGTIPARSFLRDPLRENKKAIMDQIQKTFNELSSKYK